MPAPKISQSFWQAIKLGYRNRGIIGTLPLFFLATIVLPQFFLSYVVDWLLNSQKEPNFYAIFPAFIVMGGFLGAVSINIMSQVFSLTSNAEFSDYLNENKVYDLYIFWPQYAIITQIILIISFILSIILYAIYGVGELFGRILIFDIGITLYGLKLTLNLIDMIRTLAWHRSEYMSEKIRGNK